MLVNLNLDVLPPPRLCQCGGCSVMRRDLHKTLEEGTN